MGKNIDTARRKELKSYLKQLRDKTPKGLTREYVNRAYEKGSNILGLAVMRLLEETSKDKREEIEEIEQGIGEQRFTCGLCKGDGYIHEWNEKGKIPKFIIKDCINCNGEGTNIVIVEDKRKISKEKKLEYDDTY